MQEKSVPDARRGRLVADWLPTRRDDWVAAALLAVAYAALGEASIRWLSAPGGGGIVWPGAGLALAVLAVRGPRLWPGVLVGQLLVSQDLAGGPLLALGATTAAVIPALVFHRMRLHPHLASLGAMLWLAAGGAAGATISSLAGLAAWVARGGSAAGFADVALIWWFGHLAAVLTLTATLLAWRPGGGHPMRPRELAHLAAALATNAALAYAIFLWPGREAMRSWFIFPALVWPALVFSVRGASLALMVVAGFAVAASLQGVGPLATAAGAGGHPAFTQQFVTVVSMTVLILAAVADERKGREQLRRSEQSLREETEALEILNRSGAAIVSELDMDAAVQRVTDAGVRLSGAQFGAFFYSTMGEAGETLMLYALSGAPRDAFERFGHPRSTGVFAPTFAGQAVLRSDDIIKDPRYGANPPHRGMPLGHLPVRSYLAVPVKGRSGEVLGALFFGHPDPGVFTSRTERLIQGVATQAAIAVDNARLYQAAQREIAERRRAEAHQRLLMNELNHRVKNTLATVQSMGAQTLRGERSLAEAKEAFVARLIALSDAHNLLTAENWESADLEDVVRMALIAFDDVDNPRFSVGGPGVRLTAPRALGLAMALHELGSNASKYGALSSEAGRIDIAWSRDGAGGVGLTWQERDGPQVNPPVRRGFGSRLIQEGLARELQGEVRLAFPPEGVRFDLSFRLDPTPSPDDPEGEFERPAPSAI